MRGVAILIAINIMIVVLPTISADGESDDALNEIPIPAESTEGHVVLTTDLCRLNIANTMESTDLEGLWISEHWNCEKLVWNGTFEEHDDNDVLKIENTDIADIGMIRICIENSEIPMEIELWARNTSALVEIDNSIKAETPAQISICKIYGASNSSNNEHWLNLNSLSTSGNYSISVILFEFAEIRGGVDEIQLPLSIVTPITIVPLEPSTQFIVAYSDKGVHDSINISVSNPHMIYNLKSYSTNPHQIKMYCSDSADLEWECGTLYSSFKNDLNQIDFTYYPTKNASKIEIEIVTDTVGTWIVTNQEKHNYSDSENGDAEYNLENCKNEINSCPKYINANMGTWERGYLPLSIYDEADVWTLEIPGNDGDTFIGQINARSNQEDTVFLEIWSVKTDGNITTNQITLGTNWKSLSIDFESGKHYIKFTNLMLLASEQNWSYGDQNQTLITYDLQVDWVSNYTNNSEIIGPSDELLFWDNILIWSMGPLFLLPLIYVVITTRIEVSRRNELLFDLERLKRLRKILSEDDLKEARLDLKVSLKALANIEWEIILENWGEPEISYQTSDMDIACWRLDPRLSEDNGTPIMLGINVKGEKWENAAVKFDTSSGKTQTINAVKPKLLFLNNEIFLDQLGSKSRTFVQINLNSTTSIVNIHVSGIQNGKPVAAQPAKGLNIKSEEEE